MMLCGQKILIVDDEEGLREILMEEFSFHGATVTEANSGNDAFALLRTEHFDAVITDVLMKDGDGPSLVKRINRELSPKPKIFLCTGFSDLNKAQLSELDVTAVFEKPFEREQMIATVLAALTAPRATYS